LKQHEGNGGSSSWQSHAKDWYGAGAADATWEAGQWPKSGQLWNTQGSKAAWAAGQDKSLQSSDKRQLPATTLKLQNYVTQLVRYSSSRAGPNPRINKGLFEGVAKYWIASSLVAENMDVSCSTVEKAVSIRSTSGRRSPGYFYDAALSSCGKLFLGLSPEDQSNHVFSIHCWDTMQEGHDAPRACGMSEEQ
jgi:hypothetical protein